jgi:prefoldin subunit 5
MTEKNTDRWYELLLGQMEKLNESYDKLSEKILEINTEIGKLFSIKNTLNDVKGWAEEVHKNVTSDDLAKMKEFYTTFKELRDELDEIYEAQDKIKEAIEDYKKFKTKILTILSIMTFLFGLAITVLGWFIK